MLIWLIFFNVVHADKTEFCSYKVTWRLYLPPMAKGEKPSAFKQYIIDHGLQATIDIRGPLGDFTLRDDRKPVVLFAAGVGITPVFSLLKSIGNNRQREVHVIYPSAQYHLFKDELDSIAQVNPRIHLSYLHQADQAQAELTAHAKGLGNDAYYYIAGSEQVIGSIGKLLGQLGIAKRHILSDHFIGYK